MNKGKNNTAINTLYKYTKTKNMVFKNTPLLFIILFVIIVSQQACKEKIAVPYFVHIDSVNVASTNYDNHGSVSKKITDVWLYSDNVFYGAYVLPANIPFINNNSKKFEIRAGIKENGIDARRMEYPFYFLSSNTVDWPIGTYKTIIPEVRYRDNTKLLIHEDFEIGTNFITQNNSVGVNILSGVNAFEGAASAQLSLNTTDYIADIYIDKDLYLNPNLNYFVELNYKCNIPFEVNLIGKTSTTTTVHALGGVNPSANWNKIYFNATNLINNVKANSYKLNIKSVLPVGSINGSIELDNIKLVGLQ